MKKLILTLTLLAAVLITGNLLGQEATPLPPAAPAAAAEAPPTINNGNTAWMITATALVLFMTLPGLALFYGGLVRAKNVLTILVQCFALAAIITILWVIYGYSVAFDATGMTKGVTNLHSFFGGLGKAFLKGVTPASVSGTIPEVVFATFQLTFAIITPALIVGAFAERAPC
jgi:Amt family ammonium transporter